MARGRLAYQTQPGTVEIREYELPTPRAGGLLLETVAAGICGSDVHIFAGKHPLKKMALGHEIIARVTDPSTRPLDSAGVTLSEGDRVSVVYFQGCRHCPACARGDYELCTTGYAKWMQSPDEFPHFVATCGTHYYLDPTQAFFKVPDDVSSRAATSANCALSQVFCGVDRAQVRAGNHVVIQGAGGLGLYATAVAKERGATVTVLDGADNRLETAKQFGADHVVSLNEHPTVEERRDLVFDLTEGEGADIAFDLTGVPEAIVEGVRLLRTGGCYIEIGNVLPGTSIEFDFADAARRAITIVPVIRYAPRYLRESLRFLSRNAHTLPLEQMIDRTFSLDEVTTAMEESRLRRLNRAAISFE
ncbi:MAG: zinc-binding dehydrogenase [Streptosporangiales bacterium]|nr:zinc-binding dehydrogenase [Streptosporangiales bacterium]